MPDNDLGLLRHRAHACLLAADGPLSPPHLARHVFGEGRHEDPVAELVLRRLLAGDPRFLATPAGRWLAAAAPCLARPFTDQTFAVVDLETTGSVLGVDEVIEIGVVVLRGGQIANSFDSLVYSERRLPFWVRNLTGIRNRDLRAAPTFETLLPSLRPLLAEAIFVAHDLRFDLPFLRWEFARRREQMPETLGLCTLRLAQQLWPELASWRLRALAAHFGCRHDNPHRAAEDAAAAADVLQQVLRSARERGLATLGDLLELSQDRPAACLPDSAPLAAEAAG